MQNSAPTFVDVDVLIRVVDNKVPDTFLVNNFI